MLIGGAMAYTFLQARGESVGDSRVEADSLDVAREILERAGARKMEVLLPVDHLCGCSFDADTERRSTAGTAIEAGWKEAKVKPAKPLDDASFFRRTSLATRVTVPRGRAWIGSRLR